MLLNRELIVNRLIQIIIIISLFYSGLLNAAEFRYAWISDTHVGSKTGQQDLGNTIRDINSLDKIRFVILSGDITQTGRDKDLLLAKTILDSLQIPYHIIPGNHDTKWSESGATAFARLWGTDKFLFEFEDYAFLGIHQGPLMKMADGHFAPEDLRWLDNKLAAIGKKKPLVIVSHYPLDNSIDNWFEVTERLRPYNVQFVMVGHGHSNRNLNFEGLPGVMGRSNLRAGKSSGGYNIVEIKKDSAFFFEKNPGQEEMRLWNTIALGFRTSERIPEKYERPDFGINYENSQVNITWKHNTDFTITGTPAVSGNFVLAGNTSGNLICVDINEGKELWSYKTGGPIYSSPEVYSDKVYFGSCDSNIYCLDLNGRLIWKHKTGAAIISSPVISDKILSIGASDGIFRAINPQSGELIWEYRSTGFVETKALVYSGKVIFGAWDSFLYALNISDGSLAWKWTNGNSDELYSPAVCRPVAAKGKVFIVAPDRYTTAIDISSGKTIWRSNKSLVREAIGITADSTIIIRCITDTLAALDPVPSVRSVKWISDLDYGYDINPFMPVEKEGIIFAGTKNGFLYAADSQTGKLVWKYRVSHVLLNTLTALSSDDVLITTMDGEIMRLQINREN